MESEFHYIRHLTESGDWEFSNVKSVGQLSLLTTNNKDDIVSAINEINRYFSVDKDSIQNLLEGLDDINSAIANMDELVALEREKVEKIAVDIEFKKNELETIVNDTKESVQEKFDKSQTDILELQNKSENLQQMIVNNGTEIDGKIVAIKKDIVDTNLEVSRKLSKSEYDENAGVNKWIYTFYESDKKFDQEHPKVLHTVDSEPVYVKEVDDSVSLFQAVGDKTGILHLYTNVYVRSAKNISFMIGHETSASTLVNGGYVYYKTGTGSRTVSMSLIEGWNNIEFLIAVNGVKTALTTSAKISAMVDKMTTIIGIGNKNDTRLKNAETMIKQTNEELSFKADSTFVESLGNLIENNSALLEVHSSQISSKVGREEFNNYDKRIETVETSIIQTGEKIQTLATKEEVDTLNNEVTSQSSSITQLSDSIGVLVGQEEKIGERLSKAESSILANAESIESKVDRVEYDENLNVISEHETEIKQLKDSISLIASNTDYDLVSGRFSEIEAELSVVAGQISSSASSLEVSELEKRIVSNETAISQNSEKIELKADNNIVDALSDRIAKSETELTVQAGLISSRVSQQELKDSIDNISVGGRNLLRDSEERILTADSNNFAYATLVYRALEKNSTYTLSFEAEFISGESSFITVYPYYPNNKTMDRIEVPFIQGKRMSATFTTDDEFDYSLLLYAGLHSETANNVVKFKNIKLEKGNIATDWTPAVEDVDKKISATETLINQTKDQIELKADKTDVEALNGSVSDMKSELSVQAQQIKSRVSQTEVDDSIKTAVDDIKIGGRNLFRYSLLSTHSSVIKSEDTNGFKHKGWGAVSVVLKSKMIQMLKPSTEYTISFKYRVETVSEGTVNPNANYYGVLVLYSGKTGYAQKSLGRDPNFLENAQNWKVGDVFEKSTTFTTPDTLLDVEANYRILAYTSRRKAPDGSNVDDYGTYYDIKIEEGNKATAWTPAPEEIDERITKAETEISQTAYEVSINVVKNDQVVSKINASTEGVKILGSKIDIVGNTTFTTLGGATTAKLMHEDVKFENGLNGCVVYNNATSKNVSIERIDRPSDCPTTSSHVLQVKAVGTASPNFGGIIQSLRSRAGAKFLVKYLAKVPLGYSLKLSSNNMGTGYTDQWLSASIGTGTYTEYIRLITCGINGTFSTGGHLSISGDDVPTEESPLIWEIASIEAYDLSDYQAVPTSMKNTIDIATGWKLSGKTTINGGMIETDTITAGSIMAGAITSSKISSSAITSEKISANAITSAKISADAIDGKTITGATIQTSKTATSNGGLVINSEGLKGYDSSGILKTSLYNNGILNATDAHLSNAYISGRIEAGEGSKFKGDIETERNAYIGRNLYLLKSQLDSSNEKKGIIFGGDENTYTHSSIRGNILGVEVKAWTALKLTSKWLDIDNDQTNVSAPAWFNYNGRETDDFGRYSYALSVPNLPAFFGKGFTANGTVDFTGATVKGVTATFG